MSQTNANEMRSNVLKKLAKTFDIGHLAEAFDVLFDVIKKQGDEITLLKDKLGSVDLLEANVKELTTCMKVLEYNIQGYDVKAPDSLLPAVQAQSQPVGAKKSQLDKHDIHHLVDAVDEVIEAPLPVHINEEIGDPHVVERQPSTLGGLSSALGSTHYRSVLYHDPALTPKVPKPVDPLKPKKTMISISYERRRNLLYRLRKTAHKMKENRSELAGVLYRKNAPAESVMSRVNELARREASHEHAIESLGQGLEQFQQYMQTAFPHSFFVNMRKMQAFMDTASKSGGLHALAGVEGSETGGRHHKKKHHHHKKEIVSSPMTSHVKDVPMNAFAEEEEEEEEEVQSKSASPAPALTEEEEKEEEKEEEGGEKKEREEKAKSPSPTVTAKSPSPTVTAKSPIITEKEPSPPVSQSGSESEWSGSESEEEDDFPPMPSFGGGFTALKSPPKNIGFEAHPGAVHAHQSPHGGAVRVITQEAVNDPLVMKMESAGKIPLYVCEQVREYLMNVAPLPMQGSESGDDEDGSLNSVSFDEDEDPMDALHEAHNYDKSNAFTPVSAETEEGEVAAADADKKPASRPTSVPKTRENSAKAKTDESKKEQDVKVATLVIEETSQPQPARLPHGNHRGGHHSPRGNHHHSHHHSESPSYIPPAHHSPTTGGYSAHHSNAQNDKATEKKFADLHKALDNKISKGDFEQLRTLVQDMMHQSMTREEADAMLNDCVRPEDILQECRMNEKGELVPVEATENRRRMYDPRSDKLRKCIENISKNVTGGKSAMPGVMSISSAPAPGVGDVAVLREEIEEAFEEKMHKDRKRHEKDREAFNHEIGALRKELDALNSSVKSKMQEDQSALTAWKPELDKLKERMQEITEEQKAEAGKMADEVAQISSDIGVRPTERDVAAMVKVIETGFKQRLGENIGDVKATVNAVINAVKQKSSKDEVAQIIQQRMAGLEQKLQEQKDEEESKAAMSIKCLSCGQLHKDTTLHRDGRGSPEHQRLAEMVRNVPNTKEDYEQMVAVLQRSAGLRSLDRHYNPIDSGSSNNSVASAPVYVMPSSGMVREGEKVAPEPLYRRAKLAAHMKELVKVPLSSVKLTNSAEAYPEKRYVMDNSVATSRSNSSLPNLNMNSPNRNAKRDMLLNRGAGGGYSNFKGSGGGGRMNDDVSSVTSEITIGSQRMLAK